MGRGKANASDVPARGVSWNPRSAGAGAWSYFGFNLCEIDSQVRLSRVTELGKWSGQLPMIPRELCLPSKVASEVGRDWGNRGSYDASV